MRTTSEAHSRQLSEPGAAPHLQHLSLSNFRNFEHLECEFPANGVAVVGPNGSGKTNLLEAIHYLEVFRSFRGVRDRGLVRFGQDVFRVEGDVSGGRSVAAAYDRSQGVKKVCVDGLDRARVSQGVGSVGVTVFRLEDAEIIRGPPRVRRRWLDIALCVDNPHYRRTLQSYNNILTQRNEALKQGAPEAEVGAWTGGLVDAGAVIMAARAAYLVSGAGVYRRFYGLVSGGDGAGLRYRPGLTASTAPDDTVPAANWAESLQEALIETRTRERRRRVTLVGPHRDEARFDLETGSGTLDLRHYGSRGQQRTAALALRLLEATTRRDRLGREPFYLLDDVFSELDGDRSRNLLRVFEDERRGQVILTAPKGEDIPSGIAGLDRWRIREGRVFQ